MIAPELWWFKRWRADGMPGVIWHAPDGKAIHNGDNFPREICRQLIIVLAICHKNNTPGDDRDENLW